jgi:hypothetical protein
MRTLIFLLLSFSISYCADTTSFLGTVDRSWDNAANWTNGVASDTADSAILRFAGKCSLYTDVSVRAITVLGSDSLIQNKNKITVKSYFLWASTGRLNLDDTVMTSGIINNGFLVNNSGTFATDSAVFWFKGGTGIVDSLRSLSNSFGVMKQMVVDSSCFLGLRIGGSAVLRQTGPTAPLVAIKNNAYVTTNTNYGSWDIWPTASMTPIYVEGDDYQIFNASGGTFNIDPRTAGIRCTIPNMIISGAGLVFFRGVGAASDTTLLSGGVSVAGNLSITGNKSGRFYSNDQPILASVIFVGLSAAATKTWSFGNSVVNCSLWTQTGFTSGTQTCSLQTASIFAERWLWASGTTVIPGTSKVTFVDHGGSITSANKSFYDVELNGAAYMAMTLADSLKTLRKFRGIVGKFNNSSMRINCDSGFIFNTTDSLTLNRLLTTSGDSVVFGTGPKVTSSCTLSVVNNCFIKTKNATISEIIFPNGKTRIFYAPDTFNCTNIDSSDVNGISGSINNWYSHAKGSAFYLKIPAAITSNYAIFKDCKVRGGYLIDARGVGNVDSGGCDSIRFTPSITSISPTALTQAEKLYFHGKSFSSAGALYIRNGGGSLALAYSTVGDTTANGYIPNSTTAGNYKVFAVTKYGDTAFVTDSITISDANLPVITFYSPTHGGLSGTDTVTINGYGFTTTGTVWFDGVEPTYVSKIDTVYKVIAPVHAAGIVDIIIQGLGGGYDTVPYTYDTTVILTSLTKSSGSQYGGDTVGINASSLGTVDTVFWAGDTITSFVNRSNTLVTIVTLPGTSGHLDTVIVRNILGYRDTLPGAFRRNYAPFICCISPDSAQPGDNIKLYGDSLGSIAGDVYLDGNLLEDSVWTRDSLTLFAPNDTGWMTLYITLADSQRDTIYNAFKGLPGPPGPMWYPSSPAICTTGTAYSFPIYNRGGTADSFTVSPTLPTGLSLTKATGLISGTPSVVTAKAGYKVKAFSVFGNDSTYDTITVISSCTYDTMARMYGITDRRSYQVSVPCSTLAKMTCDSVRVFLQSKSATSAWITKDSTVWTNTVLKDTLYARKLFSDKAYSIRLRAIAKLNAHVDTLSTRATRTRAGPIIY